MTVPPESFIRGMNNYAGMKDRHKDTALYREKRKILRVYTALMVLILVIAAAIAILQNPPLHFYASFAILACILTLFFLISYSDPAAYGWLMFGRGRAFSGSPWQSRVSRELTHMDAAHAAEEQMRYEEAMYHEKPDGLIDLRGTREELRAKRKIELPRPGEPKLAEGVLKCPQCDTPYVFDRDNPVCVKCGTRLHRGEHPQDMEKK